MNFDISFDLYFQQEKTCFHDFLLQWYLVQIERRLSMTLRSKISPRIFHIKIYTLLSVTTKIYRLIAHLLSKLGYHKHRFKHFLHNFHMPLSQLYKTVSLCSILSLSLSLMLVNQLCQIRSFAKFSYYICM